LRSGAHHGDGAIARSGRRAAQPHFIDGEPARWSAVGGDKTRRLRTERGVMRGRPIKEGIMQGGLNRGGEQQWQLCAIWCGERDPGGRRWQGDDYRSLRDAWGARVVSFLSGKEGVAGAPSVSMAQWTAPHGE
jgi:hypothetical protein